MTSLNESDWPLDRYRIEKIEMLDEKILLEQLLTHYALSCGLNDHQSSEWAGNYPAN